MNQDLEQIHNDIAAKHLLKHPFYLAWTRGELSKEALADYARQYYQHVAAFPTYLSAIHANCDDQSTRKELLSNLIDEEAGSPNHPELWLKFAEGLGALYAYESQIPAICESKIDGLKKHYGFADPKHYEYFSVHIEADREHSAAERKLLGSSVDNQNSESVRASVNRVLDALWEMLSGVCRRHAIVC